MKTIVVYFFFLGFWVEYSLGLELTNIPGISWFNLTVYLLLILWAFSTVSKRKLLEWNKVNTYLILCIFVVILSIPIKILIDEIPIPSLFGEIMLIKNWMDPFILFFIIFNVIDDKKTCKRALLGLVILLFITALSTPLISLHIIDVGFYHLGRASAFSDPNEYAAYLVLFIPLILTFILSLKSHTLRTFSVVVLFVTFVALVTTGSRGGIFSFFVVIPVYFFIMYRENLIRLSTLLSIIVVVVVLCTASIILTPSGAKRFAFIKLNPTESENLDDYSSGRLWIWSYGLKIFAERPIFGNGYNTFKKLLMIRFGIKRVAHNQYLSYLVELGVIGFTFFILLFFKVLQTFWNYQRATTDLWKKRMYISYIAGLSGYLFSMIFLNTYNTRYILWFYTAVLLRDAQLSEIDQD